MRGSVQHGTTQCSMHCSSAEAQGGKCTRGLPGTTPAALPNSPSAFPSTPRPARPSAYLLVLVSRCCRRRQQGLPVDGGEYDDDVDELFAPFIKQLAEQVGWARCRLGEATVSQSGPTQLGWAWQWV